MTTVNQKIIVHEVADSNWNDSLEGYHYSIFHIREWLESVRTEKTLPVYLDIYLGEKIIAKISGIFTYDSIHPGRILYFYSAPAMHQDAPEAGYGPCLDALIPFARANGCNLVLISFLDSKQRTAPDSRFFKLIKTQEFILDLKGGYPSHKPGSGLKKKLNLAQQANTMFVKDSSPQWLDVLFNLLETTKKERLLKKRRDYDPLSFKAVTRESLLKLIHSGKGVFHIAQNHGAVHYLSLELVHNGKGYGLYNGTDLFGYQNGLPAWTITRSAIEFIQEGAEYLNLGGTISTREDGEKLAHFKKQLGAIPADVYVLKSDFIRFPYRLINPFINMARILPYNPFTNFLRRFIN
jgi:hypothetical protein